MTADMRPATGIHGWLALLWFVLVVITPATGLISLAGYLAKFHAAPRVLFVSGLGIPLIAFSVFAGLKLRHTIKPARAFLLTLCALGAVEIALGVAVMALGMTERGGGVVAAGGRTCAPGLIWLWYLHRSVRVRNTYPSDFSS